MTAATLPMVFRLSRYKAVPVSTPLWEACWCNQDKPYRFYSLRLCLTV